MKAHSYTEFPPMETTLRLAAVKLFDSPQAELVHLTLRSGECIPAHYAAVDTIFYVLEGHPVLESQGECQILDPDQTIASPANTPHAIRNEGDKSARLLVIKAPRAQSPVVFVNPIAVNSI